MVFKPGYVTVFCPGRQGAARRSGPGLAARRHTSRSGQQTYRTKSEANGWLAVQAGTIAQGSWSPLSNDRMTVEELAAKWLNSNPLKQESSQDRDRASLRTTSNRPSANSTSRM
jgi:hypothetical protein